MHHVAVYTEQWLGNNSLLLGGVIQLRRVLMPALRLWGSSLRLIYHNRNHIMNVPHLLFTKYYMMFCFLVDSVGSLFNIGMVFWQDFAVTGRRRSGENKLSKVK